MSGNRLILEALAFKPDVVVIDFGANDSKHPGDGSLDAAQAVNNWRYKTNFVHDYEEMIAAFRQANPAAEVFPSSVYQRRIIRAAGASMTKPSVSK